MSVAPEIGSKPCSAEDLERLSAAGCHYELVMGELREMSPAGARHGSLTARLATFLQGHVEQHDLGEYFTAETGFLIGRAPDTVLAPDWAFIRAGRVPDPMPESFMPVVPDLVLETRSPGDTAREVALKVEQWLDAGVAVVLDLDPTARQLTLHRKGRSSEVLSAEDVLVIEDLLPGFSLTLARVFRASSRPATARD